MKESFLLSFSSPTHLVLSETQRDRQLRGGLSLLRTLAQTGTRKCWTSAVYPAPNQKTTWVVSPAQSLLRASPSPYFTLSSALARSHHFLFKQEALFCGLIRSVNVFTIYFLFETLFILSKALSSNAASAQGWRCRKDFTVSSAKEQEGAHAHTHTDMWKISCCCSLFPVTMKVWCHLVTPLPLPKEMPVPSWTELTQTAFWPKASYHDARGPQTRLFHSKCLSNILCIPKLEQTFVIHFLPHKSSARLFWVFQAYVVHQLLVGFSLFSMQTMYNAAVYHH